MRHSQLSDEVQRRRIEQRGMNNGGNNNYKDHFFSSCISSCFRQRGINISGNNEYTSLFQLYFLLFQADPSPFPYRNVGLLESRISLAPKDRLPLSRTRDVRTIYCFQNVDCAIFRSYTKEKCSRRSRSHFYFQATRCSTHQPASNKTFVLKTTDRLSVAAVRPKRRSALRYALLRVPRWKKVISIANKPHAWHGKYWISYCDFFVSFIHRYHLSWKR